MRPTTFTIRLFQPGDQDQARALVLEGLGDHFGYIDETKNPDLDDIARNYLENGDCFVVAEQGGVICGTGGLVLEEPGTGCLVRMSVAKQMRGQGLGRALVEHLTQMAIQRGYTSLVCETNDDWQEAIGLYLACGFTEIDGG
jgi:ribosomal protein S18 acetylase RimI-like enzyme